MKQDELEETLKKACKEEGALPEAQPLFIKDGLIKCSWCKSSSVAAEN